MANERKTHRVARNEFIGFHCINLNMSVASFLADLSTRRLSYEEDTVSDVLSSFSVESWSDSTEKAVVESVTTGFESPGLDPPKKGQGKEEVVVLVEGLITCRDPARVTVVRVDSVFTTSHE